MDLRPLDNDVSLPLVISPPAARPEARRTGALVELLQGERATVAERLVRHGALLLRGYAIDTPADFERVARAIAPELQKDYLGTSPRDALTEYVFSASELPPYYPIPQHCEMSFVRRPPDHLFFSCLVAPRGKGGETPLCDVRAVWRDLDPAVRDRFERRGVRIIRNYAGPDGGSRFDVWKLKRWDEMFRTADRDVVEARCRDNGFTPTWLDGGRLRLVHTQPAMKPHPRTGEPAWFNHSQVFLLSMAAAEYRRIARRLGQWRYLALAGVATAAVTLKRLTQGTLEQAMHCTYGDGTPITDEDLEAVRDVMWRHLVAFPWRRGDILAIDNHAVAHGRLPYTGERKVAVCWA